MTCDIYLSQIFFTHLLPVPGSAQLFCTGPEIRLLLLLPTVSAKQATSFPPATHFALTDFVAFNLLIVLKLKNLSLLLFNSQNYLQDITVLM